MEPGDPAGFLGFMLGVGLWPSALLPASPPWSRTFSLVAGSYCRVCFAEKINQLSGVSKTLACSATCGLEKKV